MPRKLYIGCISAMRNEEAGWIIQSIPKGYISSSPEIAHEDGLRMAFEEWPQAEGWIKHSAQLKEVEEESMTMIKRLIDGEMNNDEDAETEYIM